MSTEYNCGNKDGTKANVGSHEYLYLIQMTGLHMAKTQMIFFAIEIKDKYKVTTLLTILKTKAYSLL